jgi:sugar phosphate isomerase/epimerase
MREVNFSKATTRRQLLAASTLALARGTMSGQSKKYSPKIVCNMYYYVQLFSTPFRFISARPDPLKAPPPADRGRPAVQSAAQAPTGGMVWSREQWYTALSDVQDAGYRRLEMMSATVLAKPIAEIQALLDQYGLIIDHVWHSGRLYPAETADKTITTTIELLDYVKPLKSPDFYFDPFGDRGPLSDEDAKSQNRGLDRIGREVKDRGMKLCVHNHEGPMRYGAKEWRGVVQNTDPALVTMCLDLDWTYQAGADPFPLLYEAGDKGRLGAIHMRTQHNKIADQTMEDGGDIDFHKVAAYLKKIQFNGAVVEETEWMKETKVTRSARENKKVARIWCEKVFGVSAKT